MDNYEQGKLKKGKILKRNNLETDDSGKAKSRESQFRKRNSEKGLF